MPEGEHQTVPVQVWVDADIGIVGLVRELNQVPTIRTLSSCQGGRTYLPYVSVTWANDETLKALLMEYDVTLLGNYWGHVHPRNIA